MEYRYVYDICYMIYVNLKSLHYITTHARGYDVVFSASFSLLEGWAHPSFSKTWPGVMLLSLYLDQSTHRMIKWCISSDRVWGGLRRTYHERLANHCEPLRHEAIMVGHDVCNGIIMFTRSIAWHYRLNKSKTMIYIKWKMGWWKIPCIRRKSKYKNQMQWSTFFNNIIFYCIIFYTGLFNSWYNEKFNYANWKDKHWEYPKSTKFSCAHIFLTKFGPNDSICSSICHSLFPLYTNYSKVLVHGNKFLMDLKNWIFQILFQQVWVLCNFLSFSQSQQKYHDWENIYLDLDQKICQTQVFFEMVEHWMSDDVEWDGRRGLAVILTEWSANAWRQTKS